MSSFIVEVRPLAREVEVTEDELLVVLADGRRLAVPLVWFPRLRAASPPARRHWELLGDGEGIHWPEVDEDLSVAGLLTGVPSIIPAAGVEKIARLVLELWDLADKHIVRTWEDPRDERWNYIYPITYGRQVRHLFLSALDAADLAVHGLQWRPSPGSLALIRSLAETACVLRWLSEASDEAARRSRAYGLLQSNLQRADKLHRETQADGSDFSPAGEDIKAALKLLEQLVSEDDIRPCGPPGRRELFDRFFPEGYHTFGALSEVGSHPGFMSLVALYAETGEPDFNPTASPLLRAFWIGVAGDALKLATAATSVCLGWSGPSVEELAQGMKRIQTAARQAFDAVKQARESEA